MLNKVKKLKVPVNEIEQMSNYDYSFFKEANQDLCLTLRDSDMELSEIRSIIINKKGLFFDIDKIIAKELTNFKIEMNEEALVKVNALIRKINDSKIKSNDLEKYLSTRKINLYKNKTSKRKRWLKRTLDDLRRIRKIISNKEKFTRINPVIIDEDKLNLYIATKILKQLEKEKIPKNKKILLTHLRDYLTNNISLVSSDFKFNIEDNNGFLYETYKISDIFNYARSIEKKAEQKEKVENERKNIEKYNFNFFETEYSNHNFLEMISHCSSKNSNNDKDLRELLSRKIKLYKSLDVISIKQGINSYDRYIGLTLNNGYTILEKFYDNMKEGIISHNNAIYIVREKDFEKLVQMNKNDAICALKHGDIKGKRIIHNINFEKNVKKYILN